MLVAIAALLLSHTVSPPPPPNPAPDIAQGEFDGYSGPDLWDAWLSAVRLRAITARADAFEALGAPDGWRIYRAGPSFERDTGWWTEYFQAGYVRSCPTSDASCEWIFRSAGLQQNAQIYADMAETHFDGARLAAALRANGIPPSDRAGLEGHRFETDASLDDMIASSLRLRQVREADCPAVGEWQAALADLQPLPLAGERDDARGPVPPPIPIHIHNTLDIPMKAFGGADVNVRIEDSRNPQISTLWRTITAGVQACDG